MKALAFAALLALPLPAFVCIGSVSRNTFLPSTFTSKDALMGSALPLILLETTPIALPASSPELILKFELFNMIGFPSTLTVEEPSAVSADCAMLG